MSEAERWLYLASLVTFTFGALALSMLTASYWTARWRGERRDSAPTVFPLFTLACATAFVLNLMIQMPVAGPRLAIALMAARGLAIGALPPLMLHLVHETEAAHLPARRAWRWLLPVLYAVGCGSALVKSFSESGLMRVLWSEPLEFASGALLASASSAGLAMLALSRRRAGDAERAHRWWIAGILLITLVCAALSLGGSGPVTGLLPDYALLAFFSVSLYYRERLAFIDVLVKRGLFFAIGLAVLTLFFAAARTAPLDTESSPWIAALLLLPFWLAGPWIYQQLERAIDRVWLRRPFSPADAERAFLRAVQAAADEGDLRSRAEASLSAVFRAAARVEFAAVQHSPAAPGGIMAALERDEALVGAIRLAPRRDAIPYLSDDRRLLESLAGALTIVLDNVRYRAERLRQAEREQQLRWLAGRAELKALRAQINPHFLFNALNSIAGLIRTAPRLADETIEQLAQVFRYTLRKSANEWVPLEEEIEFVAAYLRVEKARFGDRLRLEFDLDPDAGGYLIPAMTIQPLVENAVKHGVLATTGGGAVTLRTRTRAEELSIEVRDDGPGFPTGFSLEDGGSGLGLRNVAERLRGYYGDAAGLTWESGPRGASVSLRIPRSPLASAPEGCLARADRG